MIEIALTLLAVLTLANTAVLIYALVYDRRWRIDARRIGGQIAANLIDRYGEDVWRLDETGTKRAARERYLELCGAFGLPETAVTAVADSAWAVVQPLTQAAPVGEALYE